MGFGILRQVLARVAGRLVQVVATAAIAALPCSCFLGICFEATLASPHRALLCRGAKRAFSGSD